MNHETPYDEPTEKLQLDMLKVAQITGVDLETVRTILQVNYRVYAENIFIATGVK